MCQCELSRDKNRRLTSSGVQTTSTSVAFEVLGLLMIDENLQIVEITFAIITPWSRQDLFDIWMASLLLRHLVSYGADGLMSQEAGPAAVV